MSPVRFDRPVCRLAGRADARSGTRALRRAASPSRRTRPSASTTRTTSTSCARQGPRSSSSARSRTRSLPDDIDAVYIGGGYPELYAGALSENASMRRAVREWAGVRRAALRRVRRADVPFPEHSRHLTTTSSRWRASSPSRSAMGRERAHLGYREVLLREDCILGPAGQVVRGHEFRYSDIAAGGCGLPGRPVYAVTDGSGADRAAEGYRYKNTLGSYIHVHFGSNRHGEPELHRFHKKRKGLKPMERIILVGHGSPKKDANNVEVIAGLLHRMLHPDCADHCVRVAYLQFVQPDIGAAIDACVAEGAGKVIVHPFFLYGGMHVTKDIPAKIAEAREEASRRRVRLYRAPRHPRGPRPHRLREDRRRARDRPGRDRKAKLRDHLAGSRPRHAAGGAPAHREEGHPCDGRFRVRVEPHLSPRRREDGHRGDQGREGTSSPTWRWSEQGSISGSLPGGAGPCSAA